VKILIAEDNALLGKSIKRAFEEAGWTIDLALDGPEALYFTDHGEYDVMVIDWMLPKLSGVDLIDKLRNHNIHTPIIMITARDALTDRVDGLMKGADDYLVKPFAMAELIARVRALYRRSTSNGSSIMMVGSLALDPTAHSITLHNKELELTGKEYDLLVALASKMGKVVNRNVLISLLYPFDTQPNSNSLDVLLTRIRKKLAGSDISIETIRGKGFILRVA
jgi:DNA-binding response OmpR family regulator